MIEKPGHIPDFNSIFNAHKNNVYNTVLSFVQNRHEAEDVVQEVFIQIYRTLHQFKGESKLSTWIYRIAVNTSLNAVKARQAKKRSGIMVSLFSKNEDAVQVLDIPNGVLTDESLERREQAQMLFKAINQLPENQRVAFTLSKMEGLSYAEIAEITQASIPSVESLLFRAKQNLQKMLRSFYEHEILSSR